MTKEQIYEAWAPVDGAWSAWAKPVLFACADRYAEVVVPTEAVADLSWLPAQSGTALVVDLPGVMSVLTGVALAESGYRPVPLFNAIPGKVPWARESDATQQVSMVNVDAILQALIFEAGRIAEIPLPADAAPAFLLDSNRRVGNGPRNEGRFDNRSVSLPTDFPSANVLLGRGIGKVIVIQQTGSSPQIDLCHTLLRWQKAGIAIHLKLLDVPDEAREVKIPRPFWFRSLVYNFVATLGFIRSPMGGFGGYLPAPSGG